VELDSWEVNRDQATQPGGWTSLSDSTSGTVIRSVEPKSMDLYIWGTA
jgi:hypothetical protein